MAVLLAVLLLSLHNDDVQFTLEEAGKAGSQPELLTATLRAISEASIHYRARRYGRTSIPLLPFAQRQH